MSRTESRKRKRLTGSQKVAILKRHLVDKTPISDLCDEYGILGHLLGRQLPQFLVNQGQELLGGRGVALLDGGQDSGDVGHQIPLLFGGHDCHPL